LLWGDSDCLAKLPAELQNYFNKQVAKNGGNLRLSLKQKNQPTNQQKPTQKLKTSPQ